MSLNDLAVDLTCEPQEIGLDCETQAGPRQFSQCPEKNSCGDGRSPIGIDDILESIPGSYPGFLDNGATSTLHPSASYFSICDDDYQVHGGIHKMAMEMGSIGRPVWLVVNDALKRNPSYDLVLCGHSLGAGLCTMLGLVKSPYIYVNHVDNIDVQMWADPGTCRTAHRSGLPLGRVVQVYAFAPPYVLCVISAVD